MISLWPGLASQASILSFPPTSQWDSSVVMRLDRLGLEEHRFLSLTVAQHAAELLRPAAEGGKDHPASIQLGKVGLIDICLT